MACVVDNNALQITPSRKRKREYEYKCKIEDGLSNEGFSSPTPIPKKETKKFIETLTGFTQNKKNYAEKVGMEVKSIYELTSSTNKELESCFENPYEVVRKPPKRKKTELINEEANCFVNPALNLQIPDKRFNPFEVKRLSLPKDSNESNSNCFINPGLNIRAEDNFLNPYEITRNKIENQQKGIENPALDLPRLWTLGIPFTPNIGCRINFNNIPLENLTPTKLLAEKLTFIPTNPRIGALKLQSQETFQRALPVITEETVDIGKELDSYQLELENSINEAKLKKKTTDDNDCVEEVTYGEISGINVLVDNNEPKTPCGNVSNTENNLKGEVIAIMAEFQQNTCKDKNEVNKSNDSKGDEISEKSFEDSFEDDLDFKAPTPFIRAYRKPASLQYTKAEILKLETKKSKSNPVANAIRKSIRKLIHPQQGGKSEKSINKLNMDNEKLSKNSQTDLSNTNHIFESIRHSLRRKPNKQIVTSIEQINENGNEETTENSKDITLTERQIFRSTTKEFVVENRISLRSSLRKSTKEMKNHVMKSIFKKNIEEYDFQK